MQLEDTGNSSARFLVVIVGPTGVGKTRLAIQLAKFFNTVIISADSRQFYRELKIGSGAPAEEELALVPHYFVGHLSVTDSYNVSKFEHDAIQIIDLHHTQRQVVILAGGSGLYVDAVCHGIDDLPDPDPSIRKMILQWYIEQGLEFLQEKVKELDPEYYQIVDKKNPKRLMRAIEVCLITGMPFSSLRVNKPKPRPFTVIKIGLYLPRPLLNSLIDQRVDKMMEMGLLEEARQLLPFRDLNALNTVGYKELFGYFDGKITLSEAVEKIKVNTHRFAKRQMTWFKKDLDIKWFRPDEYQQIIAYITERLKGVSNPSIHPDD